MCKELKVKVVRGGKLKVPIISSVHLAFKLYASGH